MRAVRDGRGLDVVFTGGPDRPRPARAARRVPDEAPRVDVGRARCGDAYFHQGAVRPDLTVPKANDRFDRTFAIDRRTLAGNHGRLAELAASHAGEVTAFCVHDPDEFDRFATPG